MNEFMKKAIEEAYDGIRKKEGGPFGSVIVKDGKIIAAAHNRVVKEHDPTCHGEIMAIKKACKALGSFDLSGCEIYTTGEPCLMCHGALLWANIDKVYYGCTVDDTDKIGFRDEKFAKGLVDGAKDFTVYEELDREACLKLYEAYRNLKNKTEY